MASYKDKLPSFGEKSVGVQGSSFSEGAFDWTTGFAKSALESIPELVGVTPSEDTIKFRQDNPISGFISQLAGFTVPYAGWFKATKAIKPLEEIIQGIGSLDKAPFLSGAGREIARYAPFEVGRLGASQVLGDKDFGDMFGDTALSLAAAGGIGGLFAGIGAAGTRTAAKHAMIPGVDIALPLQLRIRQINKMIAAPETEAELIPRLGNELNTLRKEARSESLGEAGRYLGVLESPEKNLQKGLNRLFKNKKGQSLLRRRFAATGTDFKDRAAWKGEAALAGLPDNFEDLGQFFRHISFSGVDKGAKSKATEIDHLITRGMDSVGDNWFITKEADDGMFVLAKKAAGEPGKAAPTDKWILFKTDLPGQFLKTPEKWVAAQVKQNSWNSLGEIVADGGDIYNTGVGFIKNFPLHNYIALSKPGVLQKLLPKGLQGPANELVARLGDAAKEYLAPAVHQFKKSPRANWVWNAARAIYDAGETRAQEILYGQHAANQSKSIFAAAMRNKYNVKTEGSIKSILDPLSDEDVKGLHYLWRNQVAPEAYDNAVAQGLVSPGAAQAAKQLTAIESGLWDSVVKAQKASGSRVVAGAKGHLGLSRSWEGDSRVIIRDEAGKPVALASGYNRRHALKVAEDIKSENPAWEIGEEFNVSDLRSIPKDLIPVIRSPGFILERQNMRGFKWDKESWTKKELLEAYQKAVTARTKYQANLSVNQILQPHVDQVAKEDPVSHRLLTTRLDALAGEQSAFSKVQNQIADKILAPIFGNNSASKIVGVTNNAMWHLQLGGLKLSYPVINGLTFIQTVMPETAYIMNAAPEQLAGRYSYFAAGGSKGEPVGAMGVLNPLKLMFDSVKEMRKPGKSLIDDFARAQNERVIDPRIVEEYIGESATKLTDLRSAFSSGSGFAGWIRALSEFAPAQSERFSRAHAFTVGHMMGRDHLKLSGENLYRFAKQFTENTMYMYQASDRPRIFTTPLGSGLGLFKNWMMNYMATMLEYTGEGLVRGNWAPLLWQTAGTGVLGGLSATPIAFAANAFSEAFYDKSLLQMAYDDWGAGDGLMFGLPASLFGVSLYSQTASPLANPVRDANMLFGIASLDRMKSIGNTVGAAFDHWQATGEHPGRDVRVREQLTRAFAPVTIYRTMSVIEDDKIRSLASGYTMKDNVSILDKMMFATGFNPVEYDKAMAIADELFTKQAKRRDQVAKLGEAWANAQTAKDGPAMRSILRQATIWGLDTSSVLKSGLARLAKRKTETLERNFKPQDLAKYETLLQE